MSKIQGNDNQLWVHLPKALAGSLQIEKGQEVEWLIKKGKLILEVKK